MRIGSVTGNSEQRSQGKETALTSVITHQMASTEKRRQIIWLEEQNICPNDKKKKDRQTKSVDMRINVHELNKR